MSLSKMKQYGMENKTSTKDQWFVHTKHVLHEIPVEIRKIHPLIFEPGVNQMFKKLFDAVEAMLRAVIYLQILLMGAAIIALGAFITFFLIYRTGQFLYVLIFKGKWL
jgi:hypothetical protein